MPFAYLFLPTFNKSVPPNNNPSASRGSSRKRKRGDPGSIDVLDNHDNKLESSIRSRQSPANIKTFAVVGSQPQWVEQLLDQGLFGKNYPHRRQSCNVAIAVSKLLDENQNILEEVPPLTPKGRRPDRDISASDAPKTFGFRYQHLAALTTILHRCISEGDYLRAGRAWGILLRAQVNGHDLNLRNDGRWGIGAEILCQRHPQKTGESSAHQEGSVITKKINDQEPNLVRHMRTYTREGLDEARNYYERIILQYPYHKAFPNAVGAMNFYPAMFGLWIYSKQEEYEASIAKTPKSAMDSDQYRRRTLDTSKGDHSPIPSPKGHPKLAEARKALLNAGEQIADRLDKLLVSPPFSDDPRLLNLREMVARWVENLAVAVISP